MHKKLVTVAMVAVLLSVASAVGASAKNGAHAKVAGGKPPIHFALIAILIPGIDLLGPYEIGANAAAKAINAAGGIGGRKVMIDTCNSQINPAVATVCAHKTLAKHPIAEFGCEVAWSATGLLIYGKAGVPSFNCVNTPVDLHNRWSFGLNPGGFGYQRAMAKYACARPDVNHVVMLGNDIPEQRSDEQAAVGPVISGCGKKLDYVFVPVAAVDVTPYTQQVLALKPDFIIFQSSSSGQGTQIFKSFQQNGFPAAKIATSDNACDATTLKQAGTAMDAVYCASGFKPADNTRDPEVAAYRKAVKAVSSEDPRNPNIEWGYHSVMWFSTAAKKIGFDKFNSAALAAFMRHATNVHMPLSRSLVNPGPKQYPEAKQPYVLITQWKSGHFRIVPTGPKKDGWILGF